MVYMNDSSAFNVDLNNYSGSLEVLLECMQENNVLVRHFWPKEKIDFRKKTKNVQMSRKKVGTQ